MSMIIFGAWTERRCPKDGCCSMDFSPRILGSWVFLQIILLEQATFARQQGMLPLSAPVKGGKRKGRMGDAKGKGLCIMHFCLSWGQGCPHVSLVSRQCAQCKAAALVATAC